MLSEPANTVTPAAVQPPTGGIGTGAGPLVMIATPAAASASAVAPNVGVVDHPERKGVADRDAPARPSAARPGRDLAQLEAAERAGVVQVDVDAGAVPLGEAEDDVEMALDVAVDAGGVEPADEVGAEPERLGRAARPCPARRRCRSAGRRRAGCRSGRGPPRARASSASSPARPTSASMSTWLRSRVVPKADDVRGRAAARALRAARRSSRAQLLLGARSARRRCRPADAACRRRRAASCRDGCARRRGRAAARRPRAVRRPRRWRRAFPPGRSRRSRPFSHSDVDVPAVGQHGVGEEQRVRSRISPTRRAASTGRGGRRRAALLEGREGQAQVVLVVRGDRLRPDLRPVRAGLPAPPPPVGLPRAAPAPRSSGRRPRSPARNSGPPAPRRARPGAGCGASGRW